MPINAHNFKLKEEYGSRKAMQVKLSAEHNCKQHLHLQYLRCTALHITQSWCKAGWFIWQLGKNEILLTKRFKLHICLVFLSGTDIANRSTFMQELCSEPVDDNHTEVITKIELIVFYTHADCAEVILLPVCLSACLHFGCCFCRAVLRTMSQVWLSPGLKRNKGIKP